MPVYEYECASCNCRFEKRQRFEDEPNAECPECGDAARRCVVPVGVIFKGSGFYKTDSRGPEAAIPEKSIKETDEKFKDTKAKIDSMAEKGDKSYPKAAGR
jgi:putative FmdB family regulatory protein